MWLWVQLPVFQLFLGQDEAQPLADTPDTFWFLQQQFPTCSVAGQQFLNNSFLGSQHMRSLNVRERGVICG